MKHLTARVVYAAADLTWDSRALDCWSCCTIADVGGTTASNNYENILRMCGCSPHSAHLFDDCSYPNAARFLWLYFLGHVLADGAL